MRLVCTLHLPEPTPSNNTIKGQHYRVYQQTRQRWRAHVQAALAAANTDNPGQRQPAAVQVSHLEIDRHSAGSGLDWDNAYGGLKPLLDCLVSPSARNPDGLGLILDDNPKAMPTAPTLRQFPAKKNAGYTVVRIYDASTQ